MMSADSDVLHSQHTVHWLELSAVLRVLPDLFSLSAGVRVCGSAQCLHDPHASRAQL